MRDPMILLFEDSSVENCAPVVATRPAFELRCGLWNLRERVESLVAEGRRMAAVRTHLRECMAESLADWVEPSEGLEGRRVLVLNARALVHTRDLREIFADAGQDRAARHRDGELIWATVEGGRALAFVRGEDPLTDLPASDSAGVQLAAGLWDHIHRGGHQICEDFRELKARGEGPRRIYATLFEEESSRRPWLDRLRYGGREIAIVHPGVHLVEEDSILFGEDCEIRPGVVLDAQRGPIVIGPGSVLHSQSVLVGPCYVGAGSVVNPATRLREATSVGALCKVGGEVEDAILLDLSNKQHDGFVGHAYLGQWVNLGADTNGSDLKNNYAPVSVDMGDHRVDTGETFVGPLIGDHAKTSINTMLNTGTFVGVSSNLFGGGFPPLHVPHFSWGGETSLVEYRIDKALDTARIVLARRDVRMTEAYARLLRSVFEDSAPIRQGRLSSARRRP